MCGVIVVDAGRSRSTNLGCDAYIHVHCLGYHHNYSLFYQFPNSNLFTHRMLFSREKPLVKSTSPKSIFYHIIFGSIYLEIDPILWSLMATIVLVPLLSLRSSTLRSNPSQSTSSHGKKNQSSWPNQTKISEKKYEAITIMHIRVQQRLK